MDQSKSTSDFKEATRGVTIGFEIMLDVSMFVSVRGAFGFHDIRAFDDDVSGVETARMVGCVSVA